MIDTQDTIDCKVTALIPFDQVDLESCPYTKDEPIACEYGLVAEVKQETPACVAVTYENVDQIGYPVDTVLRIKRRDLNPYLNGEFD